MKMKKAPAKMVKKSPVKKDEGLKALAAKNPNLTYSPAKLKKEEGAAMKMKKAAMKLKKDSTMMMKKAAMKMKKVSAMKMKMKKSAAKMKMKKK